MASAFLEPFCTFSSCCSVSLAGYAVRLVFELATCSGCGAFSYVKVVSCSQGPWFAFRLCSTRAVVHVVPMLHVSLHVFHVLFHGVVGLWLFRCSAPAMTNVDGGIGAASLQLPGHMTLACCARVGVGVEGVK